MANEYLDTYVVCEIPKTGLGNQLFPLVNAHVFAYYSKLPVLVGYKPHFRLGPYLRFEKTKRNYLGCFKYQKGFLTWLKNRIEINKTIRGRQVIYNPSINETAHKQTVYVFNEIAHYEDYFIGLKEQRAIVKKIFFDLLDQKIFERLQSTPNPEIGVHIRMSDFAKLKGDEIFRGGHVRTPEGYFVNLINQIRVIAGKLIPVTVFTDGYQKELPCISGLPAVLFSKNQKDLVDLIVLSKSKLIITSAGSTFGAWAAFLSDAIVIKHPMHLHAPYRQDEGLFEGIFDLKNELLVQLIQKTFK